MHISIHKKIKKATIFSYFLYKIFQLTQIIITQGGKVMIIANLISYILVLFGALNWGLYGMFNINLIDLCFGVRSVFSIILYVIVLLAAVWLVVYTILFNGVLRFTTNHRPKSHMEHKV